MSANASPKTSDFPLHPEDAIALRLEKARLRRELLSRRDALTTSERMERAERITDHLMREPRVQAARVVMLYFTFRSEVPTEPMIAALERAGKRLAMPHMTQAPGALVAAEYVSGDLLEPGAYGVPEPAQLRPVAMRDLDLILAPGAVFDPHGGRIGYGKGYYDRFLADPHLRAWTVGVAFDLQRVERIPVEPHDQPLHALLTETGLRAFHHENG